MKGSMGSTRDAARDSRRQGGSVGSKKISKDRKRGAWAVQAKEHEDSRKQGGSVGSKKVS